jgi:hypothetical protein
LVWFNKKTRPALATSEEREAILADQHAVFREVDAAFHGYLELVSANPKWDEGEIEQQLVRRGVAAALAGECVTFGPMAWGRDVAEQLGVTCSPLFRLHNLIDGTERDLPLANEFTFAWGRAMIGLYRTAERNEMLQPTGAAILDLRAATFFQAAPRCDPFSTVLQTGRNSDRSASGHSSSPRAHVPG